MLAPPLMPLFVIEPALQALHTESLELIDHMPLSHAMHDLAPTTLPLLVIEPAWHTLQKLFPPSFWYLPASHDMQSSA
jgi:hypothetical protein